MANYNPNLVKIHRNYTYEELAEVFGIHKNTIAQWVKNGLPCLKEQRPFLVLGVEAKAFLQARRQSSKRKCKRNEFYCVRCKKPVKPAENFVEYVSISPTKGRLTALCECCEGVVNKFVAYARLDEYEAIFDLDKSIGLEHINSAVSTPEQKKDAEAYLTVYNR